MWALEVGLFAKSEAWESGVPLDDIARVDFRHKTPGSPASDYAVEVRRTSGKGPVIKRTAELSTTNWGLGYFKYNACDYCDDVLAETADVTFGDAWIPKYVNDGEGCNVIVVRNQDVQDLFDRHRDELVLHDSDSAEVYQSQAGGFRHRRQGLAYRCMCINSVVNGLRPSASSHRWTVSAISVKRPTRCVPY